jgi:hypothetical protein
MSSQHQFYLDRAAEARAGASAATLGNVRDRWLRSEVTWVEMAARVARSDLMRIQLAGEKVAARAALDAAPIFHRSIFPE